MENIDPGDPLRLLTPIPNRFFTYTEQPPAQKGNVRGMLGDSLYVHQIKRGGMGEVVLCSTSPEEKPSLALKTFQKQFFFDPLYRISFENEAVNWSRLSGLPHIMPVVGIEEIDNQVFVIMPCVQNENGPNTFRDELKDPSVPLEKKLMHFMQCLLGMYHANYRSGILIHGDLKPENLMILNDSIYITDFGLSKSVQEIDNPSLKIQLDSTWAYKAPELWEYETKPTAKSDIYALGVILYETLVGRQPFASDSKDGWQQAHTYQIPQPFELPAATRKFTPLLKLAIRCLQKDPERRPDIKKLNELFSKGWEKIDILSHFMTLYQQAHIMQSFVAMQQRIKPGIVHALVKLNRPDLALEEINNLEEAALTPEILRSKGSCLSLLNRDEEAIPVFLEVLEDDISGHLKRECLNELGLSYKRTRQFERAEDIYLEKLLPESKPNEIPVILTNLSTVYLYKGELQKVIDCLSPMLRDHPNSAEGWANLGFAYMELRDYENAAKSFQKTIHLKPGFAQIQVFLAKTYLHLGQPEDSYVLLDSAWNQGYFREDWLELMLVACHFTGRENELNELMATTARDLGEDVLEKVIEDANRTIRQIEDEYRSTIPTSSPQHRVAVPEPEPFQNEAAAADIIQTAGTGTGEDVEPTFSLPFLNYRFYMDDNSYSIDFYGNTRHTENFVAEFLRCYNQSKNDPRVRGGNMQLRSSVFFFTECPTCHLLILTNRDFGKWTSCKHCDARFEAYPKINEHLSDLLSRCVSSVGLTIEDRKEQSVLVVIQPHSNDDTGRMKDYFLEEGYKERDPDSKQVIYLLSEMVNRNLFSMREPVIAFEKQFPGGVRGYSGQTPAEVDQLIRKVRSNFPGLRSSSMMYDTNPDDYFTLSMIGRHEEALAMVEKELLEEPGEIDLLSMKSILLSEMKRFGEAIDIAKKLLDLEPNRQAFWYSLGDILVKAGDYERAIPYLKTASTMDPLDTGTLIRLAECYQKTSDERAFQQTMMQLRSLGRI